MTTEQRLIEAFQATAQYEPNADLFSRVVHSIEEDRRHRDRIRGAAVAIAVAAALLIAVAALSVQTTRFGAGLRYRIDWRMVETLETIALVTLVLVLGPAIRRFGRGYVGDIFGSAAETGTRLMQLIDVAYYLVFSGYVLVTMRFAAPVSYHLHAVADQVEEVAARMGGLLLAMGLMHAVTLMALPLIGLVFTSTRRNAKLPRWVAIVLAVAGAFLAWEAVGLIIGLASLGSS